MARSASSSSRTREQRREVRRPSRQVGSYLKSIAAEKLEFEEGRATLLNQSTGGMLLRVSRSFQPGGILEVSFKDAKKHETTTVLKVCWSRPVSRGAKAHLIGCRQLLACEDVLIAPPSSLPNASTFSQW
jgi:c-di-GMP-binding flagellar brake protein YcgR